MKKLIASILLVTMFLTFTMSVAGAFTPPGLEKKDALPPGLQKKDELPPGIQKRFADTDNDGLPLVKNQYEAVIEELDVASRRIVIKQGTAFIDLLVDSKADIELDGEVARLRDLQKNDKVYLKLDKDFTIIEIVAVSKEDRQNIFDATIKDINNRSREVVLAYDNKEELFDIVDEAVIKAGDIERSIRYLEEGMKIEVKVEKREILEIKVLDETIIYEGRLIARDTGRDPYITIRIGNEIKTFSVSSSINLSRFNIGDDIKIYVENGVVVRITAL